MGIGIFAKETIKKEDFLLKFNLSSTINGHDLNFNIFFPNKNNNFVT